MTNISIRKNDPERGSGLARSSEFDPYRVARELFRWDPFREMVPWGANETGFVPAFEVKETKDAYIFKADLPGVNEEDLEIFQTGNRLTITGRREAEKEEGDERYYAYERSYGSFTRSFTLPDGVDSEHITGELKNGVLQAIVPKKPEAQPRKISLKGLLGKH